MIRRFSCFGFEFWVLLCLQREMRKPVILIPSSKIPEILEFGIAGTQVTEFKISDNLSVNQSFLFVLNLFASINSIFINIYPYLI